MNNKKKYKIVMLVSNPVTNDPRVTKEAKTLQKIGSVVILGHYRGSVQFLPREKKDGYLVVRSKYKDRSLLNLVQYYLTMNRFFVKESIKIKPDVIHCHDLDTLLAGYIVKRKNNKIKLVYDMHEIWTDQGLALPKLILRIFVFMEKFLLKRIDAFITVNESMIREILKMYKFHFSFPAIVLYNCPEHIELKEKKNFLQFKNKVIVFYHGGYMPNRGIEELILAGKYLFNRGIILLRIIFPDETSKKQIEGLINKNHLQKKVILLETVPMVSMVQDSVGADLGVIPYLSKNINNRLSTPNKLFEYAQAGMAIASSNLIEIKRFIKEYQNGIIFKAGNPKDIAEKLNSLIANKNKLSLIRGNSLQFAKVFNWQNEEKKLLKLYEGLLDN